MTPTKPPKPAQHRTFWDEAMLAALTGTAANADTVFDYDNVVLNASKIADRALEARQKRQVANRQAKGEQA